MHATTAKCFAGGIGRVPLNVFAYDSLLPSTVSVMLIFFTNSRAALVHSRVSDAFCLCFGFALGFFRFGDVFGLTVLLCGKSMLPGIAFGDGRVSDRLGFLRRNAAGLFAFLYMLDLSMFFLGVLMLSWHSNALPDGVVAQTDCESWGYRSAAGTGIGNLRVPRG